MLIERPCYALGDLADHVEQPSQLYLSLNSASIAAQLAQDQAKASQWPVSWAVTWASVARDG